MWTDGKNLRFNPAYAATLPEARLVAAQAHEIMHLVFGHHLRRKGREAKNVESGLRSGHKPHPARIRL